VRAAIGWLENAYNLPVVVAGFSFGAMMSIAAGCGRANIPALAVLGLPTQAQGRVYRYDALKSCSMPKLFLSGDHDQFAPAEQIVAVVAQAAEPKRLTLIPGADHFFSGQLELMQSALAGWLKEQLR
jgi:hypothetical protein